MHHFAVTAHLPLEDNPVTVLPLPKTLTKYIQNIWRESCDPLNSNMIVHDCLQAIEAMHAVYLVGGK